MFAQSNGVNHHQVKFVNDNSYKQLFCAIAASFILHAIVAYHWHSPEAEPLQIKPQQIMEVELVAPKPPEPVIKPVEPPKPKVIKPVLKPKPLEKPKPKPVVQPKPKSLPPPVQSKAPPKVLQKTYTEAAPAVTASSKPVYTPVPVFGTQNAKPSKSLISSTATKPAAKPAPVAKTGGGENSGVKVIQRIPPRYPARALSRHMEGHVTVQFTVSASGSVESPSVVSASPSGVFEEAALANIRQWRFKPKMVNGKPVSQRAVQTINFKLSS